MILKYNVVDTIITCMHKDIINVFDFDGGHN